LLIIKWEKLTHHTTRQQNDTIGQVTFLLVHTKIKKIECDEKRKGKRKIIKILGKKLHLPLCDEW